MIQFFTGLFAVMEAVPIIRDAFMSALSLYYSAKIEKAKRERHEAVLDLEKATNADEIAEALSRIIRNRAK